MYTYRIVLDAYNSREPNFKSARVVTYSRGVNRDNALRRLGTIHISSMGVVSDGINTWPGTNNMGRGNVTQERHLPEYTVVSIRSVKKVGRSRILSE
jgi:hypothetical protein